MVLCKGAESSVLQKCVSGPIDETIEHVDYYAGVCTSIYYMIVKYSQEGKFRFFHVCSD